MIKNWIILILIIVCVWIAFGIEEPNVDKICQDRYIEITKNKQYGKCVSIVDAMQRISDAHEYEKDVYDCSNYSVDLKKELDLIDIASNVLVGNYNEEKNSYHAWIQVGMWVEPINGEFVSTFDYYNMSPGEVKVIKNNVIFSPKK